MSHSNTSRPQGAQADSNGLLYNPLFLGLFLVFWYLFKVMQLCADLSMGHRE